MVNGDEIGQTRLSQSKEKLGSLVLEGLFKRCQRPAVVLLVAMFHLHVYIEVRFL